MIGLRGDDARYTNILPRDDLGSRLVPSRLLAMEEISLDEPSPTLEPLPPAETLPYVEQSSEAEIICSFDWPQGCAYWVAVASCESGLYPYASGYGGRYVGLFQVWVGHGYGIDWLTEPYNNTLAAWELSNGGTYTGAWPYCQWQ